MAYDSDTFIKNIIEHSQRITSIISVTDFNNHSLNPNIILIPSLWNNVNDAMIVWAMDTKHSYEEDCRKMAELILRRAGILGSDAENALASMKTLRAVYTSDFPEMEFNKTDCMVFLNAYDKFMYLFYTSCSRVQRALSMLGVDYKIICSMREAFLKKVSGVSSDDTPLVNQKESSIEEKDDTDNISSLLRELISETKKTNMLLEKLIKERK